MKKIISLALVLLMLFSIVFSVVSCGKDNDTDPPGSDGVEENNGDKNNDGDKNTYEGTKPIPLPS